MHGRNVHRRLLARQVGNSAVPIPLISRDYPFVSLNDGQNQTQEEQETHGRKEREAQDRAAVGADVVYMAVLKEGEEELERATSALAWSGLAAGLSMGFSLVSEGLLRSHISDYPGRPLVSMLGYSVGFLIVVLGRQQLFTENTLTAVLPLLKTPDRRTLLNVLRLWSVVFVSNIAGTILFALVVAKLPVFDEQASSAFVDIGKEAAAHGPGATIVHAIFAGWLIALMVWLLPIAEAGRIWVIIIITYIVGLPPRVDRDTVPW